jgi:hypothetical protein
MERLHVLHSMLATPADSYACASSLRNLQHSNKLIDRMIQIESKESDKRVRAVRVPARAGAAQDG